MASSAVQCAAAAPRAGVASHPECHTLFETIVCDVYWNSLEVGALAMILSACSRTDADTSLRSRRHLLRGDAKPMLLALRYGAEVGLDRDAVTKLREFFIEVVEAKSRLSPIAEAKTLSRSQRDDLGAHSAAWRRLSAKAHSVLGVLEPQVKTRLAEAYAQDGANSSRLPQARCGRRLRSRRPVRRDPSSRDEAATPDAAEVGRRRMRSDPADGVTPRAAERRVTRRSAGRLPGPARRRAERDRRPARRAAARSQGGAARGRGNRPYAAASPGDNRSAPEPCGRLTAPGLRR